MATREGEERERVTIDCSFWLREREGEHGRVSGTHRAYVTHFASGCEHQSLALTNREELADIEVTPERVAGLIIR